MPLQTVVTVPVGRIVSASIFPSSKSAIPLDRLFALCEVAITPQSGAHFRSIKQRRKDGVYMFSRSFRVVIATVGAGALGLAMASTANASTDNEGAYSQTTGALQCNSSVSGGDPGGRISVRVSGYEQRPAGHFLRTSQVQTYVVVEKSVSGSWYTYSVSDPYDAVLGSGRVVNGVLTAPWDYPDFNRHNNPRLGSDVTSSGLYRIRLVSELWNQDGINFQQLQTHEGTCFFQGKK